MVSSSEWLQPVSQRSFASLSALKGQEKTCSRVRALRTRGVTPVNSKWETASSSFEREVTVIKGKSLHAPESNQQSPVEQLPHPTENTEGRPDKNDGQPAFHWEFQRQQLTLLRKRQMKDHACLPIKQKRKRKKSPLPASSTFSPYACTSTGQTTEPRHPSSLVGILPEMDSEIWGKRRGFKTFSSIYI